MPEIIAELIRDHGAQTTRDDGGFTQTKATRIYRVTGTNDAVLAMSTTGIPEIGDVYQTVPCDGTDPQTPIENLFVRSITPRAEDNTFKITIEYSTPGKPKDSGGTPPVEDQEDWNWNFQSAVYQKKNRVEGDQRKAWWYKGEPGAGGVHEDGTDDDSQAIMTEKDHTGQEVVLGTQALAKVASLSVTKYWKSSDLTTAYMQTLETLQHTVNNATWPPEGLFANTCAIGEVLFETFSIGQTIRQDPSLGALAELVPITYNFKISRNKNFNEKIFGNDTEVDIVNREVTIPKKGHDLMWAQLEVLVNKKDAHKQTKRPTKIYLDSFYPEANFGLLQLTGLWT